MDYEKFIYWWDKNEDYLNTKQKESSFPSVYNKQSRYIGSSRGHYVLNSIVYETAHLLDINRNMEKNDIKEGPVQSHDPDDRVWEYDDDGQKILRQIKDTIKKHRIQKTLLWNAFFGKIEDD